MTRSYVYENPEVTKGADPCRSLAQAFTHREGGLWTPLVTISHMLDCQLYGLNAGGHHLTNVLLHLASVILLFLILRANDRSPLAQRVCGGGVCHPPAARGVRGVDRGAQGCAERAFLHAHIGSLSSLRSPAGLSVGGIWLVIFLFALGLMCKPMLVTLPFVLLLLDYWPLNRLFVPSPVRSDSAKRFSVNWRAVAGKNSFAGALVRVVRGYNAGTEGGRYLDIEQIPFWTRMCEAPVWFVIYLWQMIWPAGLAVIYTHPEASLPWWPAALALCGIDFPGDFSFAREASLSVDGMVVEPGNACAGKRDRADIPARAGGSLQLFATDRVVCRV